MDKQKQKEIASKGGKAAHQKGTAHEFTSEEARIAGRKGGAASRARRTGANTNAGEAEQQSMPESEPTGGSEAPSNP
jgi:general stress protein YciG